MVNGRRKRVTCLAEYGHHGNIKAVIAFLHQQIVIELWMDEQKKLQKASWMHSQHEMRLMDDGSELEQCVTEIEAGIGCIGQFVLFNMYVVAIEKDIHSKAWYKAESSEFTAKMTRNAAIAIHIFYAEVK